MNRYTPYAQMLARTLAPLMLALCITLPAAASVAANEPRTISTAADNAISTTPFGDTQQAIAMADSAYAAEDYHLAASLYDGITVAEGASAQLYYNLGNAYYRLGQMGKAVLAYERALRIDPANKDARYNLAFVNARITDRPGERGTFMGNALDAVSAWSRSDTWAWIALASFALTLGGVVLYLLADGVRLRKTGFFGSIAALAVCLATMFLSLRAASIATARDQAVITAPSTILSTVPRQPADRSQEAMLLHEGTRVHILDSVRSTTDSIHPMWYDVEIDNAHRAWINAADVEII